MTAFTVDVQANDKGPPGHDVVFIDYFSDAENVIMPIDCPDSPVLYVFIKTAVPEDVVLGPGEFIKPASVYNTQLNIFNWSDPRDAFVYNRKTRTIAPSFSYPHLYSQLGYSLWS